MPMSLTRWLGSGPSIVATQHQVLASAQQKIIVDKEVDIEFVKPKEVTKSGTIPEMVLPPQTVRIEYDSRATTVAGVAGTAPIMRATIFGVRGHPDLDDTDIAEGYTFQYEGDHFRITDVIPVIGGVQAYAVVNG